VVKINCLCVYYVALTNAVAVQVAWTSPNLSEYTCSTLEYTAEKYTRYVESVWFV